MLRLLAVGCIAMLFSDQLFGQISDYRVYFGTASSKSGAQIVLRQWQQNHQIHYLMVDPKTLATSVAVLQP